MRLGAFDSQFSDMAGTIPGTGGEARLNEAYRMAATFLSILPLLIMYVLAQRKFIEGIERTGMTGE
jgi:multiple sugar transport system permease protein